MRPFRAVLPLVLVGLIATPGRAAFEGHRLVACQERIERVAARFVSGRRGALVRCLEKAFRCDGALDAGTTNACLERVARRCQARLAKLTARQRSLEGAGGRCTAGRRAVPAASFLGDPADLALGFGLLAPLCADRPAAATDPAEATRCQAHALACGADATVTAAAPRAAELVGRLGVAPTTGCSPLPGSCGDGEIDDTEECDDGPENSDTEPDACRTTCLDATCGDGVLDSDEDCDDGNLTDADGCESDCTPTPGLPGGFCGDGEIDDDEACDDGAGNSDTLPDHCRTDCTDPRCGDGVVDPDEGEECEPPGSLLCDADCFSLLPLAGLRTVAAPAASGPDLAGCQQALLRGGARLDGWTRSRLDRCVLRLADCVLGIDEDRDPSGNRVDRCLARADRRCAAVVARRPRVRARAIAGMRATCAGVGIEPLLDPATGLGFQARAATCPDGDPAGDPLGALLACVADDVICAAEAAVGRTIPSAYELLLEVDFDADAAFPCLTDPADLAE